MQVRALHQVVVSTSLDEPSGGYRSAGAWVEEPPSHTCVHIREVQTSRREQERPHENSHCHISRTPKQRSRTSGPSVSPARTGRCPGGKTQFLHLPTLPPLVLRPSVSPLSRKCCAGTHSAVSTPASSPSSGICAVDKPGSHRITGNGFPRIISSDTATDFATLLKMPICLSGSLLYPRAAMSCH